METVPEQHPTPDLTLRDPAHQVSPKAVIRWRLSAVSTAITLVVAAGIGAALTVSWAWIGVLVLAGLGIWYVIAMPRLRYRTHRWEVTQTAIYTQVGWLGRYRELVPISRVQTVSSAQGALDRALGLSTVLISTAAETGVEIALLDEAVAAELTRRLTLDAQAHGGDAT